MRRVQSSVTRTPRRRAVSLAATSMLILTGVTMAGPAAAQDRATGAAHFTPADRPYRAIDLGFTVNYRSLTINDRGQVLGSGTGNGYLWQAGQVTRLDPPAGFDRFTASEINEAGTVVGTVWGGSGSHAATWHRGEFTVIDRLHPQATASYGISINDWGVVFGTGESTSPDQSFTWRRGTLTPLWHNNPYSAQVGINNWGDIVGEYEPTPGYPCNCRGARWHRGVLTDLGDLGGDGLWPNQPADVNNRREIVGSSTTHNGDSHAYLWRDGVIRDLGTLGGAHSFAVAINDRGVVIGHADTAAGSRHPFRWRAGTMIDLTTLGLRATDEIVEINSFGQIVGIRDGRATLFVR
ncbi:putative HAF family extracellular repeat protein [Micromonospora sp. Llam0]|uniref:hypothetical protein n=1 Tax=Micromonospora sp. Llam0 TaxID=2485143 RepID=UPI000FA396E3|nr:hypothetical protein [Micromonospora sp. Llam0]ROO52563.1 putative HAF family extracellular repeat protein [Micromonospora sp. Llam0]